MVKKSKTNPAEPGGSSFIESLLESPSFSRGKSILCRVICTPFISIAKETRGAVLVMEEVTDGDEHAG